MRTMSILLSVVMVGCGMEDSDDVEIVTPDAGSEPVVVVVDTILECHGHCDIYVVCGFCYPSEKDCPDPWQGACPYWEE